MIRNRRAAIMNQVVIHIILVLIIYAIFLMSISAQVNGRGVHQQVLEKQVALLIDSAEPGFSFEVRKANLEGLVGGVSVKDGKVHIVVDGLASVRGYPYFSRYSVDVEEVSDKFVVSVNE